MSSLDYLMAQVKKIVEKVPKPDEPMAEYEDEFSSEELDDLYQRFLALDENKMPNPNSPSWIGEASPQVQKGDVIFVLSRINYRSTRSSIQLHLSWGKGLHDWNGEAMLMWLEQYEER